MRTSTAEAHNYICPECGDELTQDPSNKGFVRHKTNPDCPLERGERDGQHPEAGDQLGVDGPDD